jgi:hypothetical protein
MRKALIVGIDYYTDLTLLRGCVNDANSLHEVLERHEDKRPNFRTPKVLTATGPHNLIKRAQLKEAVKKLFASDGEIALFYFAGHGHIEETGGFLCASDSTSGDDGLALSDVLTYARDSKATNKIIILDSCHGGIVGERPGYQGTAEIAKGMTILTASTAEQYAHEGDNGAAGVFTNLLIDALSGAAANLTGDITPGSVYAHIDQSLGSWAQRPVFKTNVEAFVSLRQAMPPIPLIDLQAISRHFPSAGFKFKLDPSFEPERSEEQKNDPSIPPPDPKNTAVFAVLQKYVKVNLVRPNAPHMWHAAMQSKSCELTRLGEHYRNLAARGLL